MALNVPPRDRRGSTAARETELYLRPSPRHVPGSYRSEHRQPALLHTDSDFLRNDSRRHSSVFQRPPPSIEGPQHHSDRDDPRRDSTATVVRNSNHQGVPIVRMSPSDDRPTESSTESSFTSNASDSGSIAEAPSSKKGPSTQPAPPAVRVEDKPGTSFFPEVEKTPVPDASRKTSEDFTRVITDLEVLMNEALSIARQATDTNDVQNISSILGEATTVLQASDVHSDRKASSSSSPRSLESARAVPLPPSSTSTEPPDTGQRRSQMDDSDMSLATTETISSSSITSDGSDETARAVPGATSSIPARTESEIHVDSQQAVADNSIHNAAPELQRPPQSRASTKEQTGYVMRSTISLPPLSVREPVREDRVQDDIELPELRPMHARTSSERPRKLSTMQNVGATISTTDFANGKTQTLSTEDLINPPPPPQGRPRDDPFPFTERPESPEAPVRDPPARQHTKASRRHSSRRGRTTPVERVFSLRDRAHVDVRGSRRFNLSRTHRRQPVARDWGNGRKRFVATIACITTALIGLVIGIYAGEVPAIQYRVVDEGHMIILGNTALYLGLALPTFFFWSLPLLHGRKPYLLFAFTLFLPLQLPPAIAVTASVDPIHVGYRVGLLLTRLLSGFALGFANMNLKMTLLDLFGASLQSRHPHQEVPNDRDFRRHGGGMGIWLGIWSWCCIGSIGVGFLIGALIINSADPAWGFWLAVVLAAVVLFLNVIVPEVRRSPHRRSVAEIKTGADLTRRIARGEVKLHISSTGPKWWWQEVSASLVLSMRMLMQPGFFVLSFYLGWVYGQIVEIVILLGALTSKYYRFRPPYVGLCVLAIPLGALLAVPFQKASWFSRSRKRPPRTDSMTFQKRLSWTSHLVRRAIFMISLPFANLAYTLSSGGPPTHFMWPTFFAGLIGFLSNLAMAECHGLIMETYDTSDLQPSMSGRRARTNDLSHRDPRHLNFSCYPRVSAGLAISQTFGFLIAACATAVGGSVERRLGAQLATGVVAVILLALTLLLIGVLWRWKEVQVIPHGRRGTLTGEKGVPELAEEDWRPIIIGNPSGEKRRMSLLELGKQSRWTEIRRRNRLMDR
ncbi:MAG: hypothetical protein M1817_000306 [Caeruleum heppii]|nr:MAG: hypothetical protein M1817_000306 [Caeruleum heppii]